MNDPIRRYPLMIVREYESQAPAPTHGCEAGVDTGIKVECDSDCDSPPGVLDIAKCEAEAGPSV